LRSNRRGGSVSGRVPSVLSYRPNEARSLSAAANGSVMKSIAARSNVPGAAQKREP